MLNRKKILAPVLASVLLLGLFAPIPVGAAANKTVEVPVNFTNTPGGDEYEGESLTKLSIWSEGEPSTYSDSYTVSYKLYVPESMIKEGSSIGLDALINFNDVSDKSKEDPPYAGFAECPHVDFRQYSHVTQWDEEKKKDVESDYAYAKKSNGYWVISYKAECGDLNTESAEVDASKASALDVSFDLYLSGVLIEAENKAVYLDDLKITKADGTAVYNQNFNALEDFTGKGIAKVSPNMGEEDEEELKLTTLPTIKTLTVAKKSLSVKAGKKVTIKATAKPSAKITYKSSNKKVATVNSKGVVTGKKAGKATITVKANGKTVKVKVTVKKK